VGLLGVPAGGAELARRVAADPLLAADVERLELWLLAHEAPGKRRLLDIVGDALAPIYAARWEGLAGGGGRRRERFWEDVTILRALAQRKWLIAKADRHLDRLEAQGFVAQDPRPRLVSLSQAIFLRDRIAGEGQEVLAELEQRSAWHRIKTPLAVTLGLLMAFLFLTQRDLFTNGLTTVGAVSGGLAALWEVLGDLRSAKGKARS
jgi:hypothetical protein